MCDEVSFGEMLRRVRHEKCISLESLARVGGMSVSHLSNIERGKKGSPSSKSIRDMLSHLGIPEDIPYFLSVARGSVTRISVKIDKEKNHRATSVLLDVAQEYEKQEVNFEFWVEIEKILARFDVFN